MRRISSLMSDWGQQVLSAKATMLVKWACIMGVEDSADE